MSDPTACHDACADEDAVPAPFVTKRMQDCFPELQPGVQQPKKRKREELYPGGAGDVDDDDAGDP